MQINLDDIDASIEAVNEVLSKFRSDEWEKNGNLYSEFLDKATGYGGYLNSMLGYVQADRELKEAQEFYEFSSGVDGEGKKRTTQAALKLATVKLKDEIMFEAKLRSAVENCKSIAISCQSQLKYLSDEKYR